MSEIDFFIKNFQPELIIHTACSYGRNGESLVDIWNANFKYGLHIIQSMASLKMSSTLINVGTPLPEVINHYSASKKQFSKYLHLMSNNKNSNLKFINLIPQHMYGPDDDEKKFTTHIIKSCYANIPKLKLTHGMQKRDFIYIDDVISAFLILIKKYKNLPSAIDIEMGSGKAPTIRDFVEKVHKITNSKTKLCFGEIPYRSNEPMLCKADISMLTEIGWKPEMSLDDGIRKIIKMDFNE